MPGKPYKRSSHIGIDICRREVGDLMPRNFVQRAMEGQILHLGIDKKLLNRGVNSSYMINTMSFNVDGNLLLSHWPDISGAIISLWDWERERVKLSIDLVHMDIIAHALFMPESISRTIVSCGLSGTVRFTQFNESGSSFTKNLAQHGGQALQLATEPGNSFVFYAVGEDGAVKHFDLRARSSTQIIRCRYLPIHPNSAGSAMRLNAIAVDPGNPSFVAVAGADEFVRVYDTRRCGSYVQNDSSIINLFCPPHIIGTNTESWITGLAFSDTREILASYSNESIYLFNRDLGLGLNPFHSTTTAKVATNDSNENRRPMAYSGHTNTNVLRRVNFLGPDCQYVASGSDSGHLFVWRKKDGKLLRATKADKHAVYVAEAHPHDLLIASSGTSTDIKIWKPNSKQLPLFSSDAEQVIPDDAMSSNEEEDAYSDSSDGDDDSGSLDAASYDEEDYGGSD